MTAERTLEFAAGGGYALNGKAMALLGCSPNATQGLTANRLYAVRWVCTEAGTLSELWAYVSATSGNTNYEATVWGLPTGTPRRLNRLWSSGPQSTAGWSAGSWVNLGAPGIALEPGDWFDVGIAVAANVITWGRNAQIQSAAALHKLPDPRVVLGHPTNCDARFAWSRSGSYPSAAQYDDDLSLFGDTQYPAILALVT